MTARKEKNELVEVLLHFELPVYVPYAAEDGQLAYKRTDIAPEYSLKVKVPAYATESKKALNKFLSEEYYNKDMDLYCPQHANIWVDDDNHEDGGDFKFEWSSGRYD